MRSRGPEPNTGVEGADEEQEYTSDALVREDVWRDKRDHKGSTAHQGEPLDFI